MDISSHHRRSWPPTRLVKRGISLVEVMIAATIFTILSVSATALFVQNQRTSLSLRYRTQATSTAINLLEQLRLQNFDTLLTLYKNAKDFPTSSHTTTVLIADPNYTPTVVDELTKGLRPVALRVNAVDGTIIHPVRTPVSLPIESTIGAPHLESEYWLTIKLNESLDRSVGIISAIELALIYRYKLPSQTAWMESSVRLVVPYPQAIKNVPASTP